MYFYTCVSEQIIYQAKKFNLLINFSNYSCGFIFCSLKSSFIFFYYNFLLYSLSAERAYNFLLNENKFSELILLISFHSLFIKVKRRELNLHLYYRLL